MKMNYKNIILLLSMTLAVACSEDFLDVPVKGVKTAEDLISELDENTPRYVVNAAYSQLYKWEVHSFSWLALSSISSDDAVKGSSTSDNGDDKHKFDNYTYGPADRSVQEVYSGNFQGVGLANQALEAIPTFGLEESEEKGFMAQAWFLRAFYYWNLVRSFGDVPLVDHVVINSDFERDIVYKRVSKDSIYQFMINDLDSALKYLPTKSEQIASDIGRPTVGAAKTFLAKINMYRENWSEVKRLTDEVIASGEYTIDNVDYAEIWREVGENSTESIWEIQARSDVANSKGITQYSDAQGVRGQFGWGFNSPSQDLVDFYETGDVRRDATVIFAADNEVMWDGYATAQPAIDVVPYFNEKAYTSQNLMETNNGVDCKDNKNLRIFRYAEVLLMNAEAAINVGGDAATPLNAVRNRAGLADAPTVDIDAVWRERRAELAMEHDRFFDLVRQGRAASVLGPLGFTAGVNEVFPIPQEEIDLSGGLLTQNDGY